MIGNKKGFILVATLWILAMLSIAASFFALWTQRAVTIAQDRQADIQGKIDMQSTQANIIYLLTTRRFTIAGITLPSQSKIIDKNNKNYEEEYTILPVGNEIAMDDRSYFGHGKALFALQDEGGLINIHFETEDTLARLLGLLGVEPKWQQPLIAKLKDYVDLDDLHRINGAESYHYKQRNLPPPTNRYLFHQTELQRILDWKEQSVLWKNHQLRQLTHLWIAARPNVNTAPSLVLQAAYNISAEAARRIIKMRETQPFYYTSRVSQIAGEPLDIDSLDVNWIAGAPRITLWYDGAQRMRQIYIRLTPNAVNRKPWQIEFDLEFKLLPTYTKKTPHHVQTTIFKPALSTKAQ